MAKNPKPAHTMGMPAGELPQETKTAIEAAALLAETETPTPQQEVKPAEVETLRHEVERLRAEIARTPESFEDRINYFKRKQELITRLNGINNSIAQLEKNADVLRKEAEEDIFSSENFSLKLTAKNGYSSEIDIFKFRNPAVLTELLTFVLDKMKEKRQDIETEISA